MFLRRIKNVESLKHLSPGEFGKLLGVDRIPESRCLREKIKEISQQQKSSAWNKTLTNKWINGDETEFLYLDGHVQVYNGYKANLGKKHVSRQKLCLPGTQDFWINNSKGLPYFYMTGQVNEKLQYMLTQKIIPKLLSDVDKFKQNTLTNTDTNTPRLTMVFDREGYSPILFEKLWIEYKIAVITYRKSVKDNWSEDEFKDYLVESQGDKIKMKLKEKEVVLNGVKLREIRRLTDSGHQTSIITTNKKLSIELIATYMFLRWTQENYFKYMRQDYAFDKITQYAIESVDGEFIVTNPVYNKLTYKIKKISEKIARRQAKLYKLMEENIADELENTPKYIKEQLELRSEIISFETERNMLKNKRKQESQHIKVKDMPEEIRYNKLAYEGKHLQNIIKMICYRAETSFTKLLSTFYTKERNEKRMLVKNIINTRGDMIVDDENKNLIISLHSLSTPRDNSALEKIMNMLNETKTKFPDTEYTLKYKFATNKNT